MPSNLRLQLDSQSTQSYYPHQTSASTAAKKQRMSLTQTYRLASTARGKLGREASRGDHDLRLLVGHANLLDSLMIELANVEREQEAWFNDHLRSTDRSDANKHVQWFDSILEENDEEFSDSDSETDSDVDADDFPVIQRQSQPPRRRSVSPPPSVVEYAFDDEDVEASDAEDDDEHALSRVSSHTPELVHEDSEDSDDDSMPPSPPQSTMEFEDKADELDDLFKRVPPKLMATPTVVQQDFLQSHSSPMISAY